MFDRDGKHLFLCSNRGSRIATGLICFIATPFQSLPEDFATVLVLSTTGLDISLWLLSKGWLVIAAW